MDAKITKERLGLLLSYDWIKIACICIAAVAAWLLLFTSTATRPTRGQAFELYTYPGASLQAAPDLAKWQREGALSFDVLEVTVNTLAEDDTLTSSLQAQFSAGQGDVIFLSDTGYEYSDEGYLTRSSPAQDFLMSFATNAVWLGQEDFDATEMLGASREVVFSSYFKDCEEYLNGFYGGNCAEGALDEAAVERNFRARMEGDKRYKTESSLMAALPSELARVEALRSAFLQVRGWVTNDSAEDPVELREIVYPADMDGEGLDHVSEGEGYTTCFAFDLSNLTHIGEFALNTANSPASGEGLCMAVLNTGSVGFDDSRFEPFTLLAWLAENYA